MCPFYFPGGLRTVSKPNPKNSTRSALLGEAEEADCRQKRRHAALFCLIMFLAAKLQS
jgi:hypothetical protein